jgi:hypothetical protein
MEDFFPFLDLLLVFELVFEQDRAKADGIFKAVDITNLGYRQVSCFMKTDHKG